ncbi:inovirus Gp2 family protein [Pseudomonas reactans]|uniref:inovirus Gp2 family protein n=1 Tax=Pseudomonas reactans TaxID=117680 RepID=UPI0015A1544A|nr:inovirus Gp2 family protein [Pseudomonas reactans]NWA68522.1 inovirus Gp2 family protein [Pseudomonas reactans]
MKRHPDNANLMLCYEDHYLGFPIQVSKGPFVRNYLYSLNKVLQRAMDDCPRGFAFRFDLRFPAAIDLPDYLYTNRVMDRFLESFKAKIKHNRLKAGSSGKHIHDTMVRYGWAREIGFLGKPHYHVLILLNRDAFTTLGNFEPGRDNIFNRLVGAWASALRLSVDECDGLVHIPDKPDYRLHRDDELGQRELFYRASYLCKSATKAYGDGQHGFGASRV